MPEGHSIHRIARQFTRNFVGERLSVSSPQGRFAEGARMLDGRTMVGARAVGKQLFLEFSGELWLRVHLGIYGAWDFAGAVTADATIRSAGGRIGQTNQRGTSLDDAAGEDSIHSIGAPRRTRLHMAEAERTVEEVDAAFPPEPVGQVRARLLAEDVVADLRGPTVCEVIGAEQVAAVLDRLGPDPMNDDDRAEETVARAILRRRTPVAALLMDQSIVSGIGNVYRAELLFRARLDPYAPGSSLDEETARALWRDWSHLLHLGVELGQMMTMDDLGDEEFARAMASRDERHWVYKREGLPCRVCGVNIAMELLAGRKLYWCPNCQR